MTRADWLALAERAERAGADGCKALDREIASALGWVSRHGQWWPPKAVKLARQRKHSLWRCGAVSRVNVNAYSTSVDAALATVPEGWRLSRVHRLAADDPWSAGVVKTFCSINKSRRGEASEIALAILSASCRARAEMETE